jgi:short-subunit dehydrogenase
MIEKRAGGVINVASTAAFQPIPTLAAYSATKAYVLSFTEALHGEVGRSGVKVMALCPGPTETAFFERAKAASGIGGNLKISLQPADEVVSLAISRFEKGERVTIPGLLNKFGAYSASFVPKSFVIRVAEKMFKTGAGI